MAKFTKRYHSRKTGRYISKADWIKEGKKGKAKREKIGKGKRLPKPTKPIAEPGAVKGEVIERLKYQSRNRNLDIEVFSVDGKIKSIRIGQRTYRQRSSIIQLSAIIEGARVSSGNRKRKRRRK
jgi:hypothetical protein